MLAAEIDAGLIQEDVAESLREEGINGEEDIRLTAELHGYGRVLTAAALALVAVKEMGGRTLIKRKNLGVQATFFGQREQVLVQSPPSYCPTCAVAIGVARTP